MTRMLRKTWPWALALALFFLLPKAILLFAPIPAPEYPTALLFTFLVAYNPAAALLVGTLAGYRHGFAWPLALLTAVAWVPAALIAYNSSASYVGILYGLVALAGLGAGTGLRALAAPRVRRGRPA